VLGPTASRSSFWVEIEGSDPRSRLRNSISAAGGGGGGAGRGWGRPGVVVAGVVGVPGSGVGRAVAQQREARGLVEDGLAHLVGEELQHRLRQAREIGSAHVCTPLTRKYRMPA